MNEKQQILLQLFCRETGQHALVDKDQLPAPVLQHQVYQAWLASKADFRISDITGGHWLKTCTAGYITEVIFHQDGKLDEYRLFDRFHTQGEWRLAQGLLHVAIGKGDNRYTFAVVAQQEVNIHSAVEHKNGELHSYLKLAQVK
ncbi:hypothetical protein [Motilimonas pumila]|uniref:Uncharacterized protein n=1 Tax=Motilimonas pumila TaxID=2303987 RepID=A0A418YEZ3_9GAMM|nr:hypothetical protein [Motilimonas pumila]RJG47766.1 hypothetical protein D1Z90_10225 [Motilimonas pumila]